MERKTKLVIGSQMVDIDFQDKDVVKSLGGTFDWDKKVWYFRYPPPCSDTLRRLEEKYKVQIPCSDVSFYRSIAYINSSKVDTNDLKKVACYKVKRWKTEDGEPTLTEEEVCLFGTNEYGRPWIYRGLLPLLSDRLQWLPFAQLPPLECDPRLRDYQCEVAQAAWRQLQSVGKVIIQMATGAGKSYLAGFLAAQLERAGYTVVLTALQKDLVMQLQRWAREFGAKRPIAVTVQTLWRRISKNGSMEQEEDVDEEEREVLKYADEMELSREEEDELAALAKDGAKVAVVVDEAHHIPARTVKSIIMALGGGWNLTVGISATPWRDDNRDLDIYAYAGVPVEPRITSSYLIQRGFAVPVEIRVVQAPHCEVEIDEEGTKAYASVIKQIVECEERNKFIVELAKNAEKPVLVVTKRVRHAEELYRMAKREGLMVGLATGVVKGEERAQIYDAVRSGKIEALFATTLADEGLDLPPLRTLIIALAGKSKTRTLQRIGRLVRPYPGKTQAVAYELYDDVPMLKEHLEERIKLYKTEPLWRLVYNS